MASFHYTVDTDPMAHEIGSVSDHVRKTTAAVVTMQAAVILAEKQAADHVCKNVNKGFYTLIRSQISQKMAKLQSDVDSHLMRLNQQRKQLTAIRERMQRDYNMISSRYLKLFNGLNNNLKQRVFELDKPVIDFAVKDMEKVSNRTKYLTATVPVSQLESIAISQKIVTSYIKYRGLKVINSMTNFLSEMYAQKKLTDQIMHSAGSKAENVNLYVPVIINESNFDKFDSKRIDITVNNDQLNQTAQSFIKNTINSIVDDLQWQSETEMHREIKSEFSKLLSNSKASNRVKEMMHELMAANNYQIIKISDYEL
jgi:hypothetical protein